MMFPRAVALYFVTAGFVTESLETSIRSA
jgi:hypothetical protein